MRTLLLLLLLILLLANTFFMTIPGMHVGHVVCDVYECKFPCPTQNE